MLTVNAGLSIAESELEESFVRSSGPGGQNVNKVATAVQLRFDVRRSPSLPEAVRERLVRLAGSRLTTDGVLIIEARRFRTQERNRQDARDRLVALVRRAAEKPKPRRPTRLPAGVKRRRLEGKRRRGSLKRQRRQAPDSQE
jgi:ribosome-associated protein